MLNHIGRFEIEGIQCFVDPLGTYESQPDGFDASAELASKTGGAFALILEEEEIPQILKVSEAHGDEHYRLSYRHTKPGPSICFVKEVLDVLNVEEKRGLFYLHVGRLKFGNLNKVDHSIGLEDEVKAVRFAERMVNRSTLKRAIQKASWKAYRSWFMVDERDHLGLKNALEEFSKTEPYATRFSTLA